MSPAMTVEQAIRSLGRPIFTTKEVASVRSGTVSATTQVLTRMERQGLLLKVKRNLWCDPADPRFNRFGLIPYLAGNHRAYLSLLSALNLHGLIDQIPQQVYAVTTGPTKTVRTEVGVFSFHRIQPEFFDGFDWYGTAKTFLIASPEKALVDALYLSTRRGTRFRHIPSLDLTQMSDPARIAYWVERIPDPRIRKAVDSRLEEMGLPLKA